MQTQLPSKASTGVSVSTICWMHEQERNSAARRATLEQEIADEKVRRRALTAEVREYRHESREDQHHSREESPRGILSLPPALQLMGTGRVTTPTPVGRGDTGRSIPPVPTPA